MSLMDFAPSWSKNEFVHFSANERSDAIDGVEKQYCESHPEVLKKLKSYDNYYLAGLSSIISFFKLNSDIVTHLTLVFPKVTYMFKNLKAFVICDVDFNNNKLHEGPMTEYLITWAKKSYPSMNLKDRKNLFDMLLSKLKDHSPDTYKIVTKNDFEFVGFGAMMVYHCKIDGPMFFHPSGEPALIFKNKELGILMVCHYEMTHNKFYKGTEVLNNIMQSPGGFLY